MPTTATIAIPTAPGRARSIHTYKVPSVRELPRRLEPVTADTFGGLVVRGAAPTHVRRGLP
jgi:hypothetical protein